MLRNTLAAVVFMFSKKIDVMIDFGFNTIDVSIHLITDMNLKIILFIVLKFMLFFFEYEIKK